MHLITEMGHKLFNPLSTILNDIVLSQPPPRVKIYPRINHSYPDQSPSLFLSLLDCINISQQLSEVQKQKPLMPFQNWAIKWELKYWFFIPCFEVFSLFYWSNLIFERNIFFLPSLTLGTLFWALQIDTGRLPNQTINHRTCEFYFKPLRLD